MQKKTRFGGFFVAPSTNRLRCGYVVFGRKFPAQLLLTHTSLRRTVGLLSQNAAGSNQLVRPVLPGRLVDQCENPTKRVIGGDEVCEAAGREHALGESIRSTHGSSLSS